MPHVIVKLYSGRSEQQKAKIADEVTKLSEAIRDFLDILRSQPRVLAIARKELVDIKTEFAGVLERGRSTHDAATAPATAQPGTVAS